MGSRVLITAGWYKPPKNQQGFYRNRDIWFECDNFLLKKICLNWVS